MTPAAASLAEHPIAAPEHPHPKAPVLGWGSFRPASSPRLPALDALPHRAYTTSGRAALLAALSQLDLPAGSGVLVPTYHCPTMVAPVICAGLQPVFYPVGADGLPNLEAIDTRAAASARAMFVAHYFGLAKGLGQAQAWCRERDVALVEDCAHSFFGLAGDRPVGCWGDYATGSISKFFPVGEAGVLVSAQRTLRPLRLARPGLRAQLKGLIDPIEIAIRHRRLGGIRHVLAPALWLKRRAGNAAGTLQAAANTGAPGDDPGRMMAYSDMGRVGLAPPLSTLALYHLLPRGPIVERRRRNYRRLSAALRSPVGARLLEPDLPEGAVPYVCPLWVSGDQRADAVYTGLREAGIAAFRWDCLWPGTPRDAGDHGVRWSRQVIQLLCHQDLSAAQIDVTAALTSQLLARA